MRRSFFYSTSWGNSVILLLEMEDGIWFLSSSLHTSRLSYRTSEQSLRSTKLGQCRKINRNGLSAKINTGLWQYTNDLFYVQNIMLQYRQWNSPFPHPKQHSGISIIIFFIKINYGSYVVKAWINLKNIQIWATQSDVLN